MDSHSFFTYTRTPDGRIEVIDRGVGVPVLENMQTVIDTLRKEDVVLVDAYMTVMDRQGAWHLVQLDPFGDFIRAVSFVAIGRWILDNAMLDSFPPS